MQNCGLPALQRPEEDVEPPVLNAEPDVIYDNRSPLLQATRNLPRQYLTYSPLPSTLYFLGL